MKNPLHHPIWLSAAGIFLAHQVLEKIFLVDLPFLDSYLDPFLMGILCPGIWAWEKKDKGGLEPIELMAAFLLLAWLSEWLFPFLSSQFVSDWRDLGGIALGLGVFTLFVNQNPQIQVSKPDHQVVF